MYDPKAPSSVLALAEFRRPAVFGLLRRLAFRRCRNDHDVDDLISDSMMRVLDPEDMPWVPTIRPFLFHMRETMRHVWKVIQRRLRTQNEIYDEGVAAERTAAPDESVEDRVHRQRVLDTQRMLGERLRDRLRDDTEALALYELAAVRDLEPSELGRELRWTVDRVHRVRKRIYYTGRLVAQEWLDNEDRRMNAVRHRAPITRETPAP